MPPCVERILHLETLPSVQQSSKISKPPRQRRPFTLPVCHSSGNAGSRWMYPDSVVIFLILAAFLLLILLAALYPYRTAFYSPKGKHATSDAPLQGEQYEQLSEHIYRMSHIMAKIPFFSKSRNIVRLLIDCGWEIINFQLHYTICPGNCQLIPYKNIDSIIGIIASGSKRQS